MAESALVELVRGVPPLAAQHLEVTVVSLVAGVGMAVPLGFAALRFPVLRYPALTAAGLIQTVPGLALLALMVPLLALTGGLGVGLSAFGFPPAVLALSLYAVLPILRNLVTGVLQVDAAAVEAARGMGMSERQILWQVQLPLAAPVIAAGLRTATVWTVGAATLATPVGQSCLGNYIFAGLQTRNWPMVLVGVAASAGLAVGLDLALGAVERGVAARRRGAARGAIAALVVVVLVALVLPRVWTASSSSGPTVRLGGKTFTEQYILVALLRARLEARGFRVEVAESLGSTVVFDALREGRIDAYVDYSGTLWANVLKRSGGGARAAVLREVESRLRDDFGVVSLGSLGFENAYALAVRRELGVRSLADLAGPSPRLSMGGDYEFFSRPEWAAVRDAYGLRFARTPSFDPTLMYEALTSGQVDVISAFSSDGRIAAHDLVVLEDPRGALPPYDAMLLVSPRAAADPGIQCALAPLVGAISVDEMRRANLMVDRDRDKVTPAEAARWLLEQAHVAPGCPEP